MSMIEKAARALCKAEEGGPIGYFPNGEPMREGGNWGEYMPYQHDQWRRCARAVIEALMEPTPEMVGAGYMVSENLDWLSDDEVAAEIPRIWQAMLTAALNEGEG